MENPIVGNIYRLIEQGRWTLSQDDKEGIKGQLVRYSGEINDDGEKGYFIPLSRQEGQLEKFWLRFDQVEEI